MEVAVEDLHLARRGDEVGGDLTGTLTAEEDLHRLLAVAAQDEVLQVQDDVGDILLDPLDGAELVEDTLDPHARDGRAGDGGQQGAAQAVAERVAKTRLQRLDGEDRPFTLGEDLF